MKTQPSVALVHPGTSGTTTPTLLPRPSRSAVTSGADVESTLDSYSRLESLLESHQVLQENHAPKAATDSIRCQIAHEIRLLRDAGLLSVDSIDCDLESPEFSLPLLLGQLRAGRSQRWRSREQDQVLAECLSENPNPVLRVGFDGEPFDGNSAGADFLGALTIDVGGNPREMLREAITTMLDHQQATKLEIQCGGRDYLLTLAPVAGADYVYIYGHDVSSIKESERRAQELALRDSLTGLPNRVLLIKRFNQALMDARRNRTALSVAFIDLDNFKQINDTLGHRAGDAALTSIARRLRESIRSCDTVARWGGDEFVIIFPGLGKEEAEHACDRIRENAQRQAAREDHCFVTLSIGIAGFPEDGYDAEQMLQVADEALLKAKKKREAQLKANTKSVLAINSRNAAPGKAA
ncbi:MAG: diguanylate cyclase (GGDEF)-like protein [Verrucomicrobiales bacterium]|jgi:diguanylate cyclase (GGDEF)-like protein